MDIRVRQHRAIFVGITFENLFHDLIKKQNHSVRYHTRPLALDSRYRVEFLVQGQIMMLRTLLQQTQHPQQHTAPILRETTTSSDSFCARFLWYSYVSGTRARLSWFSSYFLIIPRFSETCSNHEISRETIIIPQYSVAAFTFRVWNLFIVIPVWLSMQILRELITLPEYICTWVVRVMASPCHRWIFSEWSLRGSVPPLSNIRYSLR